MNKFNNNNSHKKMESTVTRCKLSSDDINIEKANVKKYMSYDNAYFSYAHIGHTSGPIRFFPTYEEAYKTTLLFCKTVQEKEHKPVYFSISDNNDNTIRQCRVTPAGKIIDILEDGTESEPTTTIFNELELITTTKHTTIMENNVSNPVLSSNLSINIAKATVTTESTTIKEYTFRKDSETIKQKTQIFLDAGLMTAGNIKFLTLDESSAAEVAHAISNAAINNKALGNDEFKKCIHEVSDGMIIITKLLASGKPIDDRHVSFHDDVLYCATHCKTYDKLFDGQQIWRRVPGKIAYEKVYDSIMEMYHLGHKLISSSDNNNTGKLEIVEQQNVISSPHHLSCSTDKISLTDLVETMTATIMLYMQPSNDFRKYLNYMNSSLTKDIDTVSHGIFFVKEKSNIIEIGINSGRSIVLDTNNSDEKLRQMVSGTVYQLLIGAYMSDSTRGIVSNYIDHTSIMDTFYNTQISSHNLFCVA